MHFSKKFCKICTQWCCQLNSDVTNPPLACVAPKQTSGQRGPQLPSDLLSSSQQLWRGKHTRGQPAVFYAKNACQECWVSVLIPFGLIVVLPEARGAISFPDTLTAQWDGPFLMAGEPQSRLPAPDWWHWPHLQEPVLNHWAFGCLGEAERQQSPLGRSLQSGIFSGWVSDVSRRFNTTFPAG